MVPNHMFSWKEVLLMRLDKKMVNKRCLNPMFNQFILNAPFLYPLKTSENRKVFWCFQGLGKECISNEWLKLLQA